MRMVTQIRMIDWHYFEDETIDFGMSNLITGDNGAGKSTIIDALQVIFIANLRKVKFNMSAHEQNTKRTIVTYLMGKTGTEGNQEFLRNKDDFSSFLVLEIKHVHTEKKYLLGVVFDVSVATKTEEHTFFKIDEASAINELFYDEEDIVRNRANFFRNLKQNNYKFKSYRNNLDEYLYDVRQLAGGIKDSFFSLIQKGISFTPITNLRTFVYDYILDEEPVDVDTMRSYVDKFRKLEDMIQQTEIEIAALEKIEDQYSQILKVERTINIGDYMMKRADWQTEELELKQLREMLNIEKSSLTQYKIENEEIKIEQKVIDDMIDDLTKQIANHDITRKEKEIIDELNKLEEQLVTIRKKREKLENELANETHQRSDLLVHLQKNNAPLEIINQLRDGSSIWQYLYETKEIEYFPENYINHNHTWLLAHNWLRNQDYEWRNRIEFLKKEKSLKKSKIAELEKNQILTDNHPSMKLKRLIQQHLTDAAGQPLPVHILCEVVDVKNPKWKNAIEGYLHTQKFDLLVPRGFFDKALSIYEKYKTTHEIERVGLVNTDKILMEHRRPLIGSLAEEITTSFDYVKAYINRLIGGLIKCESEQELKKFKRSITATCMVYQNHTARQLPKSRYDIPYIGRDAIQVQLKQTKEELLEINNEISSLSQKTSSVSSILKVIPDKGDRYAHWHSLATDVREENKIKDKFSTRQQELFDLDKFEVEGLMMEKKNWMKKREKNDLSLEEKQGFIGRFESSIYQIKTDSLQKQKIANEKLNYYQVYRESMPEELLVVCDEKWMEEINVKKVKDIFNNYKSSTEGFYTKKTNLFNELIAVRTEYNGDFGFGANPKEENNTEYWKRVVFLKESSLLEYKEKSKEARQKANETFQEHFIAKLKENIERAKSNFKMLDHSMKNMTFGTDSYRFRIMGKADMLSYYRMITDPDLDLGHSLFSNSFHEKHGEIIDELFMNIAEDQEAGASQLEYYTDYRNYLDFELEIIDDNGNISKFSKVALEKSGGETQVPFYVAILASFYHTYEMYHTKDTLRLVVFDEAFNRMDADRVEEAVQFILKMGFQPIIVAPTGKIQLLAPQLQNTLIVMKDNFVSFTERFSRNDLQTLVKGESFINA